MFLCTNSLIYIIVSFVKITFRLIKIEIVGKVHKNYKATKKQFSEKDVLIILTGTDFMNATYQKTD